VSSGQVDPLARESLLHSMERQVVGVLADHDVSEQARRGQSLLDHRSVRAVAARRYHDAALLARTGVLDSGCLHAHQRCGAIVELLTRLLTNRIHGLSATSTLAQCFRWMDLDTLYWQMIRQLVATVGSAVLAGVTLLLLGIPCLVFRGGDLLGKRLRHDERGHLAEGHLHLVGVDALALVLRA
jgi:hypothetical protein